MLSITYDIKAEFHDIYEPENRTGWQSKIPPFLPNTPDFDLLLLNELSKKTPALRTRYFFLEEEPRRKLEDTETQFLTPNYGLIKVHEEKFEFTWSNNTPEGFMQGVLHVHLVVEPTQEIVKELISDSNYLTFQDPERGVYPGTYYIDVSRDEKTHWMDTDILQHQLS